MKLPATFYAALIACFCCATASAQPDTSFESGIVAEIPPYQPQQSVSGVIRVWGHGHVTLQWMKKILGLWEEGFKRFQPGVTIQYEMHGTSSAIPALARGVADLAILGEEIDPDAVTAFEKIRHHPPSGVEILTGSLDVRNFDYAQMFYVHKDNPITHLTLAQLDAIFGSEHRRGTGNIRFWDQLGLSGEWAGRSIKPYGWAVDDSFGLYLQQALLGGSHRWNGDLTYYRHIYRPDGSIYDHGQQILDNLAKDRYGIAISNKRYENPDVKAIAIGLADEGPFYQASKKTLVLRQYPLTRLIPAFYDRAPGMPVDPKIKEFLRFILSREGQQAAIADDRYLPITKDDAARELKKLD
ncbi:MAG: hypothetical protein JOZ83_01435 [Silvibacterium sp.]|nr:hypothetical protein [Silvibacterium sp.]